MFSNKQLKDMILPLVMEQFLLILVGLADTVVVSYAGEAAVSGVSLVNSFNTIFIYLFTALASGGGGCGQSVYWTERYENGIQISQPASDGGYGVCGCDFHSYTDLKNSASELSVWKSRTGCNGCMQDIP